MCGGRKTSDCAPTSGAVLPAVTELAPPVTPDVAELPLLYTDCDLKKQTVINYYVHRYKMYMFFDLRIVLKIHGVLLASTSASVTAIAVKNSLCPFSTIKVCPC